MKFFLFLLPSLFFTPGVAQVVRSSLPVRYTSTVTYSHQFKDVFSSASNQASLSQVKNIAAGLYSEKRFLLHETKALSALISFPCWQGGAAIAADYAGFTNYNASHAALAYGISLGEKIDVGMQFNYNHINLVGYGGVSALTVEMGTIFHLTDKINAGCHIYNPVGGKFGKDTDEKIASVYRFGLGFEASGKLFIGAQLVKEEYQPADVDISIHYAFEKQFFIRGGISSAAGNYLSGVGLSWNKIRLDIAADWHPQAGLTPSLLLIFFLSSPKVDAE